MDVVLRNIAEGDIELIRTWRNAPEVASYMYTDQEITAAQQKAWFERIQTDTTSKHWLVQYGEEPVGVASLTRISDLFSSCHWAFYIGNMNYRGSGLGFKIEYQVISYVFRELKLNKLICEVFTSNDSVIRMHELFGFRREAYYRQHVKKNGRFQDVIGLALLKSEWNYVEPGIKKMIYRNA